MPSRPAATRAAALLGTLAIAACGRVTPAPVPVTDAAISPGEPTAVLVPVEAITPRPDDRALIPVVPQPTTDAGATAGAVVTTPDLIGPAGDLGGGGGGGLLGSPSPIPTATP